MKDRAKELLSEENARLQNELHALTNSKAYRLGVLARVVLKEPKKAIRKAVKVASNPRTFSKVLHRSTNNIVNFHGQQSNLESMYQEWRSRNDPTEQQLEEQRSESLKFKKKPVISIITPVFRPPVDVLSDLIESVLAQTYPYFELCLAEVANDAPTREVLSMYAKKDKRIKIKFFEKNGGISIDSNACLKLATGEYIALLDHDDLLSPNALYENAKLINEADYDFIYSDKDKITPGGHRYEPLFKPEWSPEMMFNANYLTHFNVFKHSLIKKIGGWHSDTDGAQDWDLFFRLIEVSKKVGHVPKILYHWRVLETSTAHSISTKPYALAGQRNAVQRATEKMGVKLEVTHDKNGTLQLDWSSQDIDSDLAVIYIGEDESRAKSRLKKMQQAASGFNINYYFVHPNHGAELRGIIEEACNHPNIVFMRDEVDEVLDGDQLRNLLGWLYVPGVASATPHIYSEGGQLIDPGRMIGYLNAFGPFYSGDSYMPHIFGFKEWVRNISVGSPYLTVVKAGYLKDVLKSVVVGESFSALDVFWLVGTQLRMHSYRAVSTPYVTVSIESGVLVAEPVPAKEVLGLLADNFNDGDIYFNENLSLRKPGPYLMTDLEAKEKRINEFKSNLHHPIIFSLDTERNTGVSKLSRYQSDSLVLSSIYDFSLKDIELSKLSTSNRKIDSIESAVWFLPPFTTLYAGLKNIFAFAATLSETDSTKHTFLFQSDASVDIARNLVLEAFPLLKDSLFINNSHTEVEKLPPTTLAVCTLWTTAYDLLRFNKAERKCYIVQDWEPSFYPKGTIGAMAEASYDFGFTALAGTQALADMYTARNKDNVAHVLPSLLELDLYSEQRKNSVKSNSTTKRVMFYARPDTPRNAFEMGVVSLTKLKQMMGDNVEVVLAGAPVDQGSYDIARRGITIAGKVPYSQLAAFYSSFDACLFLMYSEHPGVVPLEMMASGVPVVVNDHANGEWNRLYIHNKTCVRTASSATEISLGLHKVLSDEVLRSKITKNGIDLASQFDAKYYRRMAVEAVKELKRGKK